MIHREKIMRHTVVQLNTTQHTLPKKNRPEKSLEECCCCSSSSSNHFNNWCDMNNKNDKLESTHSHSHIATTTNYIVAHIRNGSFSPLLSPSVIRRIHTSIHHEVQPHSFVGWMGETETESKCHCCAAECPGIQWKIVVSPYFQIGIQTIKSASLIRLLRIWHCFPTPQLLASQQCEQCGDIKFMRQWKWAPENQIFPRKTRASK